MASLIAILRKKRRAPRILPTMLIVAGLLAVSVWALRLAAHAASPPRFVVAETGLLEPVDYPAWQRAGDWLAQRKYIVLTFDDGPQVIDNTILSILAKHHARAVFFEVCTHVTDATRDIPERILAAGDLLGNHSYSHQHLPALGMPALIHQIDGCGDQLEALTGTRPVLFRPPWGQIHERGVEVAHQAGEYVVQWNANSGDTWLTDPQSIVRTSLYEASLGGRILLMHSRPLTAEALDELLTKLEQRGFTFVLPSLPRHAGVADRGAK